MSGVGVWWCWCLTANATLVVLLPSQQLAKQQGRRSFLQTCREPGSVVHMGVTLLLLPAWDVAAASMVHAVACWLARCCYCVQHVSCVVFGCVLAAAGRLLVTHVIEAMRTHYKACGCAHHGLHVVAAGKGCLLATLTGTIQCQLIFDPLILRPHALLDLAFEHGQHCTMLLPWAVRPTCSLAHPATLLGCSVGRAVVHAVCAHMTVGCQHDKVW